MATTASGVVGTDNASPIYDPDRRWTTWNKNEIYMGLAAQGKYVPNVGDEVHEITGNKITRYIVTSVNPSTLVPVLTEADETDDYSTFTVNDLLWGVGPGTQSDTYRVFIDKSVIPHRLVVDARLRVAGTMCKTCKLFRGADVSETGVVVSRVYGNDGTLLNENVQLELVATEALTNLSIKVVRPCYTNFDLVDGEMVTAVFYDDEGGVVSKRQLLVENTQYIRSTDASMEHVVAISLESPFLDVTGRVIQFPVGVTTSSLSLMGVVTYSSGRVRKLPVDGTKFSLFGLDQYAAMTVGQEVPVVLTYHLEPNEINYVSAAGSQTHISESYTALTISAAGTYSLQLYPYPKWKNSVEGYKLSWFLYSLDRNMRYDVTTQVRINTAVSVFDPLAYGQLQRLTATVDLKEVDPIYASFVHVQVVDVVLVGPGTDRQTNWQVGFKPGQNPKYGTGVYAKFRTIGTNQNILKIDSGFTTQAQWLENLYYLTKPQYDINREEGPLVPNYFAVVVGANRYIFSISNWNAELTINAAIANSTTVYVQFIKRSSDTDLHLSVAGLPAYRIDSSGNYI